MLKLPAHNQPAAGSNFPSAKQLLLSRSKACRSRHSARQSAVSSGFSLPRKRADWELGPSFQLSKQDAVKMQMAALHENTRPYNDHGIEVLYRFANFDPFCRTTYFGRSLDLGQFERFRRIMHTPYFSVLLSHTHSKLVSDLQISEHMWVQRVWVKGFQRDSEDTFSFRMHQRLGGRYDGIWFTESLTADKCPREVLLSV